MLFNSFEFLVFFLVVTTAYFILPHKLRWVWILAASCYFYMAFIPVYILILGFTIVIDYFAGIFIEKSEGRRRKLLLMISLIANIGVLAVFKYFNFLNENLTGVLGYIGQSNPVPFLTILLPIGLSFHTFQAMSYTIEVYRGHQKAERNFGIYSLYVMFYPQLVAGPIERPQNLLHQFHEKHYLDWNRVWSGIRLMAWGLFKKVVIADRLAMYVNEVYNDPGTWHGAPAILAVIFFSFQIYCDFSGYSDIAIGAARVMGYNLMANFNYPYLSKNISDFWRRWHISLSTWFKDYLYIPLGGNRVKFSRVCLNLMIVFVVSGIWHGANWTFVVWGALHGIFTILFMVTGRMRSKLVTATGLRKLPWLNDTISTLLTFGLVTFAWIFFRAKNFEQAFDVIKACLSIDSGSLGVNILDNKVELAACFLSIILLMLIEWRSRAPKVPAIFTIRPIVFRWASYLILLFLILQFGVFHAREQFIYFQF